MLCGTGFCPAASAGPAAEAAGAQAAGAQQRPGARAAGPYTDRGAVRDADRDAVRDAVRSADRPQKRVPRPQCHKAPQEDGGAGTPATRGGGSTQHAQSGQQGAAFAECPPPGSHAALGAAHRTPPVPGPAPGPPLSPVELSVLRV